MAVFDVTPACACRTQTGQLAPKHLLSAVRRGENKSFPPDPLIDVSQFLPFAGRTHRPEQKACCKPMSLRGL